jgi:hypothetical protein
VATEVSNTPSDAGSSTETLTAPRNAQWRTGEAKVGTGLERPGREQWKILVLGIVRLGLNADDGK